MDKINNCIITAKLLNSCNCNLNSLIYNFALGVEEDVKLYTQNLHNLPQVINSAVEVLTFKKTKIARDSIYYINLKKLDVRRTEKFWASIC